jgi:hypothetical protein
MWYSNRYNTLAVLSQDKSELPIYHVTEGFKGLELTSIQQVSKARAIKAKYDIMAMATLNNLIVYQKHPISRKRKIDF